MATHRSSAAVKVVKAPVTPAPVTPAPVTPSPVLLKKPEPAPLAGEASVDPRRDEASARKDPEPSKAPAPAKPAEPEFSRLRISTTPAPSAARSQEPARYIQLPQTHAKGRPESGARTVVQRPGQGQPQAVQRSGQPQPEKTVLPMATNTGKGEVRHNVSSTACLNA